MDRTETHERARQRAAIFDLIEAERRLQDEHWGSEFDRRNTPNDWVAYITRYVGHAVTFPWDGEVFRKMMLKVATLAVAALECEDYAARHYDSANNLKAGRVG